MSTLIGLIAIAVYRIKKKYADDKIKIDDTAVSVDIKDGYYIFILLYFLICISDWVLITM